MKLSSKFSDLAIALLAIAVSVISINGCTKVDDSIGYNLMPDNQKMTVHIDTLSGVKTYLYRFDSIVSSNLEYAYLGKEYSSVFGERRNSLIIQFLPSSIPYESGFGLDPIVDTLYLSLAIDKTHGNTDVEQTFEVFRVYCDTLSVDSTYYSTFRFHALSRKTKCFSHSNTPEKRIWLQRSNPRRRAGNLWNRSSNSTRQSTTTIPCSKKLTTDCT